MRIPVLMSLPGLLLAITGCTTLDDGPLKEVPSDMGEVFAERRVGWRIGDQNAFTFLFFDPQALNARILRITESGLYLETIEGEFDQFIPWGEIQLVQDASFLNVERLKIVLWSSRAYILTAPEETNKLLVDNYRANREKTSE